MICDNQAAEDKSPEWYAVYTRHQHEKTVAQVLANKKFDVFLPLCPTRRRWKDRYKEALVPLFPCYLFIRGGLERRLHILVTPGVHNLVCSEGQPAPIPRFEIEAIRRLIEQNLSFEPSSLLKCGGWVRMRSGPLEGIEGILIRKKNQFRLVLSVEILQKSVTVEVDASLVERAVRHDPPVRTSWKLTRIPTFVGRAPAWPV